MAVDQEDPVRLHSLDDCDAPEPSSAPSSSFSPPSGLASVQFASPAIDVLAADIDRLESRVRTFVERFGRSYIPAPLDDIDGAPGEQGATRSALLIAVRRLTRAAVNRTNSAPRRQLIEAALWAIQIDTDADRRKSARSLIRKVATLLEMSDQAGEPLTIGDTTQDELEALLGTVGPTPEPSSPTSTSDSASDSELATSVVVPVERGREATVDAKVAESPTLAEFERLVEVRDVRGAAAAACARRTEDVQMALEAIHVPGFDDWKHPTAGTWATLHPELPNVLRLIADAKYDEATDSLREMLAGLDCASPTTDAIVEPTNLEGGEEVGTDPTSTPSGASTTPSSRGKTTLELFLADAMVRSGDASGAAALWQQHIDRRAVLLPTLWNLARYRMLNGNVVGALDLVIDALGRNDLPLDLVHLAASAALENLSAEEPSMKSIGFLVRHGGLICDAAAQRVRLSLMPPTTAPDQLLEIARRASSLLRRPPLPDPVPDAAADGGAAAVAMAGRWFDQSPDGRAAFRLWLNARRHSHPLDPAAVLAVAELERSAKREGRARDILRSAIERVKRDVESRGRPMDEVEAAFITALEAAGPLDRLPQRQRPMPRDDSAHRSTRNQSGGRTAGNGPTEDEASGRVEPSTTTTHPNRPSRSSSPGSADNDRNTGQALRSRRVAPPMRRPATTRSAIRGGEQSANGSIPATGTALRVRSQRASMRTAFTGATPITFPRREQLGYTIEVHPGRRLVIELRAMAMADQASATGSTGRVGLFVDVENIAGLRSSFDLLTATLRRLHLFASTLGTVDCAVAVMSPWTIGASWVGANDVAHAEGFEVVAPPIELGESGNDDTRRNAADFAMLGAMEHQVRELELDTVVVCSGDAAFYQFVKTHVTERGDAVIIGRPESRSGLFENLAQSSKSRADLAGRCELRSLAELDAAIV